MAAINVNKLMFKLIAVGQYKYQMFHVIDIGVSLKMSPFSESVEITEHKS